MGNAACRGDGSDPENFLDDNPILVSDENLPDGGDRRTNSKDRRASSKDRKKSSSDDEAHEEEEKPKEEIEILEELLTDIEGKVNTFAVRYRVAVSSLDSSSPKMTAERGRSLDDAVHRVSKEVQRLERGAQQRTKAKTNVSSDGVANVLGMRKRRFQNMASVVRKVMAEIRVARLLSRWTDQEAEMEAANTADNIREKFNRTKSVSLDLEFAIDDLQTKIEVWDAVSALELNDLCEEPLTQVFMAIWTARRMSTLCRTKKPKVLDYIRAVEQGYKDNPYHNKIHAAEVTLMTYQFYSALSTLQAWKGYFEQVDLLVLLVSAAIHDIGHPACNNDFMVKTKNDLALRYHDTAVLENFHLATAFELMRDMSISLLEHYLPSPPVTSLRRRIVEVVLATDMAMHKQQVDTMQNVVEFHPNRQDIDKRMLEQYLVHTADIGHALRPVGQHQEWTKRVNEEFFAQGDKEKELGLTPINLFDREKAPALGKGQLGFLKFVVQPVWAPLVTLLAHKSAPPQLYFRRNLQAWQDLAEEEETAV